MRTSLIQFRIIQNEKREETFTRMSSLLDRCKDSDLIVLPEMWANGYYSFANYRNSAETLSGDIVSFLKNKAKELNAYIVGGSFIEKSNDSLYNTLVMVSPDQRILATYRKRHLVTFGSEESVLLSAGSSNEVIDTPLGKIGFAICYDLRFPEMYRDMADQGVEFIIQPSAWAYPRIEHWKTLSQSRAIENVCYMLACNCVGVESGYHYFGHSQIVNPWGTVIAGGSYDEEIIIADIERSEVARIQKALPVLKDRK